MICTQCQKSVNQTYGFTDFPEYEVGLTNAEWQFMLKQDEHLCYECSLKRGRMFSKRFLVMVVLIIAFMLALMVLTKRA
jgi:hypothetical protein